MNKPSEFIIENHGKSEIHIYVEPEGAVVALGQTEKVLVRDPYKNHPVAIHVSANDAGVTELSIWPGDGDTIVLKDGTNVLDLG